MSQEYDYINPDHYKKGSKEVFEMMIDIWGKEAYIAHCEICAFKYRMRLGSKPDQPIDRDLEKANWYESKAKELREVGCPELLQDEPKAESQQKVAEQWKSNMKQNAGVHKKPKFKLNDTVSFMRNGIEHVGVITGMVAPGFFLKDDSMCEVTLLRVPLSTEKQQTFFNVPTKDMKMVTPYETEQPKGPF